MRHPIKNDSHHLGAQCMGYSFSLHIEEYSRLLFEEATDALFITSPKGIYLAVNRSGYRLLGYEDGELIGNPISLVITHDEVSRLEPALAAIAAGVAQTEFWEMRPQGWKNHSCRNARAKTK